MRGCGPVAFAPAPELNSLTSPRQRTPWLVFLNERHDSGPLPSYYHVAMGSFRETQPFRAVPNYRHLVSGSFHPPSGVLFSFPSRYCVRYRSRDVFRVGSWCLPASRTISKARYSGYPTQHLPSYTYGAITLSGAPFQELRLPRLGGGQVLQPHIPSSSRHQVRFALCPFRSPLLRASRLLSPPPGTKMFQFPGFPFAAANGASLSRQEVPFGDPGFKGCMRLARAYRSLPRPSSAPEPNHPPSG